jgi:hypothetical protein
VEGFCRKLLRASFLRGRSGDRAPVKSRRAIIAKERSHRFVWAIKIGRETELALFKAPILGNNRS